MENDSEKCSTIGDWTLQSTFAKQVFDLIIPSMRTPKIPKGPSGGPKWQTGFRKLSPLGFRPSRQLSQNRFPNLSTPSMRKVYNLEKKKRKRKKKSWG